MNWGNWTSPKIIPPFGVAGSSIIPPGSGGVTLDALGSSTGLNSTGTTDNSFTIGSGSNQLLVVLISQASASPATPTVTWNGVSLGSPIITKINSVRVDIFVLVNPAQGNHSLVYGVSAGNYGFSNGIPISFNGVNQSTPTQNSNTSTTTSLVITTAANNETVVAAAASGSLTAVTNTTLYVNSGNGTAAARNNSSSGSTTYTLTASGSIAFAGFDILAA